MHNVNETVNMGEVLRTSEKTLLDRISILIFKGVVQSLLLWTANAFSAQSGIGLNFAQATKIFLKKLEKKK